MSGRSARAVLAPVLRVPLGLIAVLVALMVVVLGVRYAGAGEPGRVDARIVAAVYGVGPPWHQVALALDFLGEPAGSVMVIVAVVTGCLLLRCPRAAVLTVAGVAVTVEGGHVSRIPPVTMRKPPAALTCFSILARSCLSAMTSRPYRSKWTVDFPQIANRLDGFSFVLSGIVPSP